VDDRWTFTLLLSAIHTVTFMAVWGGFSLCFRRGIGARFQAAQGKAPPAGLMRRAVRDLIGAQFVFPLLMYFVAYPLWVARGGTMELSLPGPAVVLTHLLVYVLLQDTLFYWSHRSFHTSWLFRHVHYLHHRFVYVRGPVAEFSHPLEGAANFIAFFAGPLLLGSPLSVLALWVFVRIIETVEAHSGYALTPWGKRHAFHHLRASGGCYGSFWSPWDALLGTDRQWRAWQAKQEQSVDS